MLQNCPLTGAGRKDDENIPEILAIVTKHCECSFFPLKFFFFFFILQYCISFAIYQNESSTGIHVFPILKPPPSSLPIPSLWVMPVHQPQASSIMHQTWTGDSFHIWYYTCFNAILPNHPTLSVSHRVQKIVLYISVSFAVSSQWILGVGDGQGGLACCCSWGRKE